jgi:hypothetical protein
MNGNVWGRGDIDPPFLTSALDGGEWPTLRLGRFTHAEIAPGTYWIGGWVGPRASLDAVEKKNILSLPGIQPHFPEGTTSKHLLSPSPIKKGTITG